MAWFNQLRQAEFRGVKFGVSEGVSRFGRRNVIHQYPTRDEIWVEDLGRDARRIHLVGFLVENSLAYGGGDVISQRDRLIAAAEGQDIGKLVHPTLGELTVSLMSVEVAESWHHGRVFELNFAFIEAGRKIFPSITLATQELSFIAAAQADLAAAQEYVAGVREALAAGAAVIHDTVSIGVGWLQLGQHVVDDASSLYNLVVDLPGQFGRFFGLGLKGIAQATAASIAAPQTLADLVARGAANRVGFREASDALLEAAGTISQAPDEFSAAAQRVIATILSTSIDPLTALRILQDLADFGFGELPGTAPVSQAINAGRRLAEQLFRRACLAAMARAVAGYQPSSYDDAVRVRNLVCDQIEDEEVRAADAGDDASFAALRALRSAVAQDMMARGANLAVQVLVRSAVPQPSLVLAQKLYRDPTRADELVTSAAPVHPAFMPLTFYALNK